MFKTQLVSARSTVEQLQAKSESICQLYGTSGKTRLRNGKNCRSEEKATENGGKQ